jgi:ankyrin repeat protein
MFPNPHDALPLPPRSNLDQYKKRAKDLLKAARSSDPLALRKWFAEWIEKISAIPSEAAVSRSHRAAQSRACPELAEGDLVSGSSTERSRIDHWTYELEKFARQQLPHPTWGRTHSSVQPSAGRQSKTATLASAQVVVARAHGFESWPKLAKHIEAMALTNSSITGFEQAADAIVTSDLVTLEKLLRNHPELSRAHSTRTHQSTLLHYVAANGIEGYRQKTPQNIVPIAKLLLSSGADVNAIADLYGGSTTLSLVATSLHPERAGVQDALLQLLLDHGATIEAANSPAEPLINICLANGRGRAAEFLSTRGAHLDLEGAAGVGRLDVVKSYFDDAGALKAKASTDKMQRGFLWACEFGYNEVVSFLLDRGASLESQANTGQTALHWAIIGGRKDTIELLLDQGASLESKNICGGTALGQAHWSAENGDAAIDYARIITLLKQHGAKQ